MSSIRQESIAACTRSLRGGLIVLVLTAALQPPATGAQTQGAALPVVTIGSVNFVQSKFDPALNLRDSTPGRPPVEAVIEWSVEAPPQSVQASQPAAAQRQTSTETAPQPAADQRQTSAETQLQPAADQRQTSAAPQPAQAQPQVTQTTIQSFLVELTLDANDGSKRTVAQTVGGSARSVTLPPVDRPKGIEFTTFKLTIRTTFLTPTSTTPISTVAEKSGAVPPLGQPTGPKKT